MVMIMIMIVLIMDTWDKQLRIKIRYNRIMEIEIFTLSQDIFLNRIIKCFAGKKLSANLMLMG